jgi:ribosomal protein L11 methyltransferase
VSHPDGEAWHAITVCGAIDNDAVSAALFALGAEGVWLRDDAVVTHLAPGADVEAVRRAVLSAAPAASVEVSETPAVDWSTAWREQLTARPAGDFVVTPPWLREQVDPSRAIVIEPGMGFGTGDHPTTRGVLRLLPGVIRDGDQVADLGAGSAVLSIAAARYGAARVWAIELDPPAIPNAELNVSMNGVGDRVTVLEGDASVLLPLVGPVRVVCANIISSVLVELFPVIRESVRDDWVLLTSGVLISERPNLLSVIDAEGWRVDAEDVEGEWWSARIVAA